MKILLVCTAYNGLTQRAHLELLSRGHQVQVELALGDAQLVRAAAAFEPELVVCPFLKSKLPEAIWKKTRSIVIHPGIVGDKGPSALDWAIHEREAQWGVTAFEANDEFDAGDVWATEGFELRCGASKASVYRQEVTDAAIACILRTVDAIRAGDRPTPLAELQPFTRGRARPLMTQDQRAIDWSRDTTDDVLRRIHAADSAPGARSRVLGLDVHLYGAHPEASYRGEAGAIVAQRDGAVCIATVDGAVWVSHLRCCASDGRRGLKLPAATVLGERLDAPERALPLWNALEAGRTWREIGYEEADGVGYLRFDFHNGAMSTAQCRRLQRAFRWATSRPTRGIVLLGGEDFHSNGIDLVSIEAAADPADESWRNIVAIDDLVLDVMSCTSHLTVSAVQGNAGAGGAIFALAADLVVARSGRVFNPHYRTMGLYGSEYWTYLLPRRVGAQAARELTEGCLPLGAERALAIGFVDALIDARGAAFGEQLADLVRERCEPRRLAAALRCKRAALAPPQLLARHRAAELAQMRRDFRSRDYELARKAFVYKHAPAATPLHLSARRQPESATA